MDIRFVGGDSGSHQPLVEVSTLNNQSQRPIFPRAVSNITFWWPKVRFLWFAGGLGK